MVEAAGVVGGLIRVGQAITMNPVLAAGNRWSHAAVYVGHGEVVDATFGAGIQRQSIWNYCQHRATTLRRIADPSISAWMIASCAALHVGEPYAVLQPLLAKLGWASSQQPNPQALFCSTFVSLAVAEATGIDLISDPRWQPPFPAVFANHSDLGPVPLEWRNI